MNSDLDQALKSVLQGLNFIDTGADFADADLSLVPVVATAIDAARTILESGNASAIARLERSLSMHTRRVELFGDLLIAADTGKRFDLHSLVEKVAQLPDSHYEALELSTEEALAHWDGAGGSPPELLVLVGPLPGAPRIACQVIVHLAHLPEPILWDRIEFPVERPWLAIALLDYIHTELHIVAEIRRPQSKPMPPLYRYHPERFQAFHSYMKALVDRSAGRGLDNRTPTVEDLEATMGQVMLAYNQQTLQIPLRERRELPALTTKDFVGVAQAAMGVERFVRFGRQIFDLPPSMVEMFRHTDVDDVPLEMLKLPYASFYIRFGATDLELAPGWKIDGAYVHRSDDGVFGITMTSVPNDPKQAEHWSLYGEHEFTQQFADEHRGMTVGHAVDSVLSRTMAELRRRADGEKSITDASIQEAGLEPSTVRWIGAETAQKHLAELPSQVEAYRSALRLVINAICYLTAYRDDVEKRWPEGSPKSLTSKVARLGKEGQRAVSKLEALGYRAIHFCGVQFEAQAAASRGGGSTRAAGWVIGHWKRQVHGAGRAQRKLIWIMPYMTHRDEDGPRPPGHLYLCS